MGALVIVAILIIGGIVCFFLNKKYGKIIEQRVSQPQPTGRSREEYGPSLNEIKLVKRIIFISMVICFAISILSFILSTFRVINAGHVGVPTLFGEVQPKALPEGLNVVNPLWSVTSMDCRVQKSEGKYDAASKDLQNVHVIMALNFEVIPTKATEIYQRVGIDYIKVIIDPAAQEVLKAHTALYNAAEILMKRPMLKQEVQKDLAEWLVKYGIRLKEISLANIKFDPDYETAISKKQVEEQKAEQKKYELLQAKTQAEIVAANAKGEADAAVNRAKGNAESKRIEGDAAEYYNKKVSASLTPILIQQQYFGKWDGKLPVYMMGDKTGIMNLIPVEESKGK